MFSSVRLAIQAGERRRLQHLHQRADKLLPNIIPLCSADLVGLDPVGRTGRRPCPVVPAER